LELKGAKVSKLEIVPSDYQHVNKDFLKSVKYIFSFGYALIRPGKYWSLAGRTLREAVVVVCLVPFG
jgi:hypothetical protein